MAIGTALAIGGGIAAASAVGNYMAGKSVANAQGDIAMQQQQMAQQVLQQQEADRNRALGLSQPSMSELAMIAKQSQMGQQALDAQLSSLKNDEQLLNSVDPALKGAGEQAYQLLQGKEAAALDPLRRERDRQREQLKSTLRSQLGGGFETSTAGASALRAFDNDTSSQMIGAQQNTLASFLGLSASIRPDLQGKIGRAYQVAGQFDSNALTAQQNIAARQVAAFNGSPVNYAPLINTAGASSVAGLGNAQALGGLFQGFGQLGGIAAGYGLDQQMQKDYFSNLGSFYQGQGIRGNPSISVPAPAGGGFTYGAGSMVPQTYQSPSFGTIR